MQEILKRAVHAYECGDWTVTERLCASIVDTGADHSEAANLLASVYAQTSRLPRAAELLHRLVASDVANAVARNNLGNVLHELGQFDDALACFEACVALRPAFAEAWNNRGTTLRALKRYDEALTSFETALRITPGLADAQYNRGVTFEGLGRWTEACAAFEGAIECDAQHSAAQFNLALCRLRCGDFKRGWEGYEWRWRCAPSAFVHTKPRWRGEPLAGKTILLHSEQGLGDTLQFCRYAELISARGGRVVLAVFDPLAPLLEGLSGVAQIIRYGGKLPAFDFHCPLLSLPGIFGTDLQTIPVRRPYLKANAGRIAAWSAHLGIARRPRVGLVWSGNPQHENDHQRSIPLADLVRHLPAGVEYFSLQKELRAADAAVLRSYPEIRHFGDALVSFSDTAALCELMDVVISVDTSVAHLVGALGRPVWILLPFPADWRWLLERDDSPWYPSATLFRQHASGGWKPVLQRVAAALAQRSAMPARTPHTRMAGCL